MNGKSSRYQDVNILAIATVVNWQSGDLIFDVGLIDFDKISGQPLVGRVLA